MYGSVRGAISDGRPYRDSDRTRPSSKVVCGSTKHHDPSTTTLGKQTSAECGLDSFRARQSGAACHRKDEFDGPRIMAKVRHASAHHLFCIPKKRDNNS